MGQPYGQQVYSQNQITTVAASQTNSAIGSGTGHYISHVVIIPATVNAGAVTLSDGATDYLLFTGGNNSVNELRPIVIPLGKIGVGAWTMDTGANVSAHVFGDFT